MIEYTVIWWDSDEGNTKSMILESPNFDDAFAEATTAFEFKQYRQIKLSDGSSEVIKDNPHYDPNYITQTEAKQQSDVIFHKPTNGSRSIPESSDWATLYRVCGWLFLVLGIIGTIGTAQENEEAGFTFDEEWCSLRELLYDTNKGGKLTLEELKKEK